VKLRALTLLSALGLLACGSGDDEDETTPPGAVCTYVSALRPRNSEAITLENVTCLDPPVTDAQPAEQTLLLGCDRRLGVDIDDVKGGWVFRQPEACSSAVQCGYWVVELDPDPSSVAPPVSCDAYSTPDGVDASGNPSPDFSELPDPTVYSCAESATQSAVLDLRRVSVLEGPHVLRATLMDSSRTPFPGGGDPNLPASVRGGPIELPVVFELETCSEPDPEAE
jgi:hypothetical protein